MPGRVEVLRRHHEEGWRVLGIGWQPAIADGGAAREDVDALVARLPELLGVPIEVELCPHAAGPPVCWCRKPLPGLGALFVARHTLAPARCVYVGSGAQVPGFARRLGFAYRDSEDFFRDTMR